MAPPDLVGSVTDVAVTVAVPRVVAWYDTGPPLAELVGLTEPGLAVQLTPALAGSWNTKAVNGLDPPKPILVALGETTTVMTPGAVITTVTPATLV